MNENAKKIGAASTDVPPSLSDDVFKVVTMIRQELAALDLTMASGGTPLTELTKLSAMLHALAPGAVPIGPVASSTPAISEDAWQQDLAMLPHVEIASENLEQLPHVVQPPIGLTTPVPTHTANFERPEKMVSPALPVSLQNSAPTSAQALAAPSAIHPQQLMSSSPNIMHPGMPAASEAPVMPAMPPLPAYYFIPQFSPGITSVPYSAGFDTPLPGIGESPVDITQLSSFASDWPGPKRDIAPHPSVTDAGALPDINVHRLSRTIAPVPAHFIAPMDTSAPAVASSARLITNQGTQFDERPAKSSSSDHQEAAQEPRQGMLYVDGAQLGRWVVERLSKYASRPTAGTTGIDPRITASFPGAPVGA